MFLLEKMRTSYLGTISNAVLSYTTKNYLKQKYFQNWLIHQILPFNKYKAAIVHSKEKVSAWTKSTTMIIALNYPITLTISQYAIHEELWSIFDEEWDQFNIDLTRYHLQILAQKILLKHQKTFYQKLSQNWTTFLKTLNEIR